MVVCIYVIVQETGLELQNCTDYKFVIVKGLQLHRMCCPASDPLEVYFLKLVT